MPDVIVVGGGIIGLTAATRLCEQGAEVTLWAPGDPGGTTSAVAAAAWYPTRIGYDPRVLAWADATYKEFRRQARTGVPGVLVRETRNLERDAGAGAGEPWWAPAAGRVRYCDAEPPWTREVRFEAPMVEMDVYLPWLRRHLEALGGRVVRRRVDRLEEALVEAPTVVNATGLAAGTLCGDHDVFPVRGQIVLVANPGIFTSVRTGSDPATYVHPRTRDVVLGGTFEENSWNTTPDPATREAILERCRALVPELAGAPVVGEKVGLRPVRRGGPRVEAEKWPGGTVVHAYGHGGAGMTLSWGCADEVAKLAG
ncbi:FAD-dependent oxidoreductase [Actinoplanes sp. N902-109]|uniref:FAD-dependent oxidoreductase n=1 Tax=Actinoplanes sp. (strain N902-109) TaxID=649831 RepID=UPI00032948AA|nr:FAD-dependent oxidoreductase [Actinoplanes sp. N902-109]AGL17392.1 D-amino acid oxidase [Actinoplanes sp. N902-109]